MKHLWCKIKQILGADCNCVIETPVYDKMIVQLSEIQKGIHEVKAELQFDKELLLKQLYKKDVIIKAMIEELPSMLWFKDMDGKYLYANKAIRDGLLFDDEPEGKTDIIMAKAAKAKFGAANHTFGEICGNSDEDVIKNNYVGKKYVESGKIKGDMVHLEVNKSIVYLGDEPVGVIGSATNISEYRRRLLESNSDDVFKLHEFTNKDL